MATDSTARKLKHGSWSLAVIKREVPDNASKEGCQRRDVACLTRDADRRERCVKNYFIYLKNVKHILVDNRSGKGKRMKFLKTIVGLIEMYVTIQIFLKSRK